MTATPAALYLPGGHVAPLIPGTRPARYDGWEGSVEIPEDLTRAGWFWFGSFLSDGEVGIFTGTYGVEGAFEQARIHMRLRAARPPAIVQLRLFEEAA